MWNFYLGSPTWKQTKVGVVRLTWPLSSSALSWSSSSATSPGSSSTAPSSSWLRRCSGARLPSPPPTITYAWPASTTGSSLSTPPLTSSFTAPWGKTLNWPWIRLGKGNCHLLCQFQVAIHIVTSHLSSIKNLFSTQSIFSTHYHL